MQPLSRRRFSLLSASAFLAGMSAPRAFAQTPIASPVGSALSVTVDAHDFSYDVPEGISAGWVTVVMKNVGKELHHAQVMQLNPGVTIDDVKEGAKQGPPGIVPLGKMAGGPATCAAGLSGSVTIKLVEGDYALICFLKTADGRPHYMEGMIEGFSVGPAGQDSGTEPTATADVRLTEWAFTMPTQFKVGTHVWKVANDGGTGHEMNILKLPENVTVTEALTWLGSSTEVSADEAKKLEMAQGIGTPIGGMQGLMPGDHGYVNLDLTKGSYIAECIIPLPNLDLRHSHADMGMIKPFIVL